MKRSANAVWNGGLKDGQGVFSVGGNAPGRPPSPTVLCGRLRRAWPELACACCGRRPDSNLPGPPGGSHGNCNGGTGVSSGSLEVRRPPRGHVKLGNGGAGGTMAHAGVCSRFLPATSICPSPSDSPLSAFIGRSSGESPPRTRVEFRLTCPTSTTTRQGSQERGLRPHRWPCVAAWRAVPLSSQKRSVL